MGERSVPERIRNQAGSFTSYLEKPLYFSQTFGSNLRRNGALGWPLLPLAAIEPYLCHVAGKERPIGRTGQTD